MDEEDSPLTRPNLPEAHLMLLLMAVYNINRAGAVERREAMLIEGLFGGLIRHHMYTRLSTLVSELTSHNGAMLIEEWL